MIEYEKNGVVVRTAVESDIDQLKDRLRDEDEKEIIAAGSKSAEAALKHSFSRSRLRYSVELGNSVVAMFGVMPDTILGGRANVWFLGAPEMSRIKKTFVKLSRRFIDIFLSQYPDGLWNYVDCRYCKTISWLRSCGARFIGEPFQLNGQDFQNFIIIRRT